MDVLLKYNCNVDIEDADKKTALFYACKKNSKFSLQIIEKSYKINFNGHCNRRALHEVVINKRADLVEALLDKGADVNVQDALLDTPLHLACERNALECVKLIGKQRKGTN